MKGTRRVCGDGNQGGACELAWLTNVKGLDEEGEVVLTGIVLGSLIPPYASAFRAQRHNSPYTVELLGGAIQRSSRLTFREVTFLASRATMVDENNAASSPNVCGFRGRVSQARKRIWNLNE